MERETGLVVPPLISALLGSTPLVGLTFAVSREDDLSGLGVEMRWMTPDEMIDEATAVYPGIAAAPLGFLPVGICLEGTGDPYFLRLADGAVVRIPHDAVVDGLLDVSMVEVVSGSVSDMILASKADGS